MFSAQTVLWNLCTYEQHGVLTPVTVLQAGPCPIVQVKTMENDGYSAVQLGFGDIREKLVNKPRKGQFAKAGVANKTSRFCTVTLTPPI